MIERMASKEREVSCFDQEAVYGKSTDLYRVGLSVFGCSDANCIFKDNTKNPIATDRGCQCRSALVRTKEGIEAVKTIDWLRDRLERKTRQLHRVISQTHYSERRDGF